MSSMPLMFFFGVVSFLLSMVQGLSQCECALSNVVMDQEVIQILHGMTKYSVTLTNNGTCSQSDLVVSCLVLAKPELGDEKKIRLVNDGFECLINDGKPVVKDNPIKFKYAATEKVEFTLIRAQFNCS